MKVKITTNPGANRYAAQNERIIEFSAPGVEGGGGLISFSTQEDGGVHVSLYRLDDHVTVDVHPRHLSNSRKES